MSFQYFIKGTSTLKKNHSKLKSVWSAIIISLALVYHENILFFVLETALNKLRGTTDVMMDIEEMRVRCHNLFSSKYLTVKNSQNECSVVT